ncbi:MAG: DNA polymerase III subunit gamma/tau [Xanthobacteraceae bacterium]
MNDATTPAGPATAYRVLARKYRPSTFADLIGQDAMVRTISNAFEAGRIPQAWILTGVRGVGKTTTARILARALNYELPDGSVTGPTIHMPVLGVHCQAIMESRHLDVIEMDAASHNSVEDVRTINEAIRYAPVSARYKIYILDEVHMLSGSAFNALLKTLEEPPAHAKFVFATTEIRKVPITVLSRCQRFDLRRLDAALLVKHLQNIAAQETIEAEPAALALIARVAEGSVRDALSLLDQAIAHAAGPIHAEDVRQMLGLADRARVIDLFGALMGAELPRALTELRDQYDKGADPATVLGDLAEFTHFVTRVKAAPALAEDASLTEQERTRGRDFAAKLSMRVLARTWQMLLKGIAEVQEAGRPLAAAEMVLVRIAYAADLPTPDEAIRLLADAPGGSGPGPSVAAPASARPEPPPSRTESLRNSTRGGLAPAPVPVQMPAADVDADANQRHGAVASFAALVALAGEKRDLTIKSALERSVRLVRFEDSRIEIALEENAPKSLVGELSKKLADWTGKRWMVIVSSEPGEPTMYAQEQARKAELKDGVRDDPLVRAVLARFPGAEIVGVRAPAEIEESPIEPPTDAGAADDEE